jgi:hypothetical protein
MEELLFENPDNPIKKDSLSPLDRLFQSLQQIFYTDERPQGKVIISLRKEWIAEFNDACTRYTIGEQALLILNQLQQEGKLHGEHKKWPEMVKQALNEVKVGN